ncbi:MAG: hypothetical protein ACRBFS_24460, partial [Aureispira sp.]
MTGNTQKILGVLGLSGLFLLMSNSTAPSGGQNSGQGGTGSGSPPANGNGFVPVKGYPGSLDESYLDTSAPHATLPTRYNNPLAVKYRDGNAWNGKILRLPGENRAFEKFVSYPHGIRVGIYLLKNRYLGAGYDTV